MLTAEAPKCSEVLAFGRTGATVDEETDSRVCGRPATVMIDRSLIGRPPLYRCGRHAEAFLAGDHGDVDIVSIGADLPSEYGRLLAERDRLIGEGVDPADLDMPLPPPSAPSGEPTP